MADVLKNVRAMITTAAGAAVLDGAGSKTYTILSISLCNTHLTVDEDFDIYCTTAGEGTPRYVYKRQSLPALATFIHSDKIVLLQNEELWVGSNSDPDDTLGIHVVVSYLEQDDA
jgi:hypothetical protein